MIKSLNLLSTYVNTVAKVVITTSLLLMTIILAVQIVMRYFFSMGIIWSDEISRFAMISIVYLGASIVTREKDHITVSILEDIKPSLKKYLAPIQWISMIIYSIALVIFGFKTLKVVETQHSANMEISMAYIYAVIPLSAIFMIIHLIRINKSSHLEKQEEL